MQTNTCLIPLTQGQSAIVSMEDYDFLMQYNWYAQKHRTKIGYIWYAAVQENGKTTYMHRIVATRAGLKKSIRYDHADRDGLNNARDNIRACTISQNNANSAKRANSTSKYKGVYWDKNKCKWRACIKFNRTTFHLGRFSDELDAHHAYATAAERYFGEFARP